MKNSQSKFSNKRINSGKASSLKSSSTSKCCCGSKPTEDIDELEIIDIEEK